MFKRTSYLYFLLFIIFAGCKEDNSTDDEVGFLDFPYENFNQIHYAKRFAYMDRVYREDEISFDSAGVVNIEYQGQRSFHPVQMFLISERFFHSYRLTGLEKYIRICDRQIEALTERAVRVDGAIYFPYDFDFQLHGNREVLKSPWYSGMAQGYALTLLARLYTETGNEKYKLLADKVLKYYTLEEFDNLDRSKPWISYSDSDNYMWLSEYPTVEDTPTKALNGFIFSASGLYELYIATKNPDAKKLLNRSLLTLRDYIEEYRNKNGISFYCLKHLVESEKYHQLHIKQFQFLYDITSDSTYLEFKNDFIEDFS